MGRDDLSITIPTLFRCPISLDVMTSPVSLSTGVTYDRSSIQRWLDSGNNTCPATMQVLENKDLVPNLTLQRLIQIWSAAAAAPSSKSLAAVDHEQARRLIDQIGKSDGGSHDNLISVTKLMRFAVESDDNRKFLATVDGFVPLLIRNLGSRRRNFQFGEKLIQLLGLVLMENRDVAQLAKLDKDRIAFMLQLLQRACLESKIATVRVLEILAGDSVLEVFVAEQTGMLPELLRQASIESDSDAIEAYLSCLISLSSPKRIRVRIARLGVVKIVGKMLLTEASPAAVIEKALKLLELVSTCKEGRSEISENGDCMKAIVMKVLKISKVATEVAVAVLWTLCCLFREERAKEMVMKNNGLGKILVLIQSDCSPAVRRMSGDLLKVFKVNYYKACISSYETMTTHIAPF